MSIALGIAGVRVGMGGPGRTAGSQLADALAYDVLRSSRAIGVASLLLAALASGVEVPGGTVDGLARTLAVQVRTAAPPWRKGDVALVVRGTPAKLAHDLEAIARARIEAAGFRSAQLLAVADPAAAERAGIDLVVEVEVALSRDGARLDGMALELGPSPWRDQPTALAHLHASVPLDGELRAYLPDDHPPPKSPPGPLRSHGAPVGDVALLALDVGDVEGDGRAEVVGATADQLVVWRYDPEKLRFNEVRRTRLIGKPAPVRPRADVATVAVERGEIWVRSSRFAEGSRIARERVEPFQGFVLPGMAPVSCALEPGVDWFRDVGCAPAIGLPPRFWSAAGLRGSTTRVAVDPDRTLWISRGDGKLEKVRPSGAQVAVATLDRGEVVATSDPVDAGGADALIVRSLAPGAPVLARLDRLPGAVVAIAAGDIDGDGRVELVVAVRDRSAERTELWVVY